jgi:hypothetical protein
MLQQNLRALCAALALFAVSATVHATLIVTLDVTPSGAGLFHYDVEVTNTGVTDVALVSLSAPIGDAAIGASLVAPAGFLALYDDLLGFIDFVEDSSAFAAAGTVQGFGFDSANAFASGFFDVFTAIDIAGRVVDGHVSLVPEPGGLSLVGAAFALLTSHRRRAFFVGA